MFNLIKDSMMVNLFMVTGTVHISPYMSESSEKPYSRLVWASSEQEAKEIARNAVASKSSAYSVSYTLYVDEVAGALGTPPGAECTD